MKTNETMKSRRFVLFVGFIKIAVFTTYLGVVLLLLSADIDNMNMGQFCVFVGVFIAVVLIGQVFKYFLKKPNNPEK